MSRNALHERLRDNPDVLKVPGGNDRLLGGEEQRHARTVERAIGSVGHLLGGDAGGERDEEPDAGRLAGALLGAARSNATVDAVVVASAIGAGGGVILTGDPGDLEALAVDHPDVVIRSL